MVNPAQPDRVIRTHDLPVKFGLSRSQIYNLAKTDPTFPTIFKLGPHASGVMESDADRWLAERRASAKTAV